MTPNSKAIPLVQLTIHKETEKYFKNSTFNYAIPDLKTENLLNSNANHWTTSSENRLIKTIKYK